MSERYGVMPAPSTLLNGTPFPPLWLPVSPRTPFPPKPKKKMKKKGDASLPLHPTRPAIWASLSFGGQRSITPTLHMGTAQGFVAMCGAGEEGVTSPATVPKGLPHHPPRDACVAASPRAAP
eukprot:GGOE01047127.1.p5 GENE.GGOE01047127.1~~GGOE01047127.1.p5  ORF type:complete len:122 (+),score=18.22 GGOE01047127.1:195-560(+)